MKILVTAQAFSVSGRALQSQLEALGCSILHSAPWGPLNENDLIDQAAESDAIIAATDSYTPIVFKSLPNLKLIARCGVGIDSVNLAAATQAGVIVTNVPEAMTDAVADYCFGLLLSAARHIHTGYACMKSNGWNEFPGIELSGKRLGLVGFGRIGQAVAKRAFGFGLRVAAYDPLLESMMVAKQAPATLVELASHIEWLSFDALLKSSDFVSIHAPNSPENKHLFSTDSFRKMQPHALLINTSRGGLIDTNALIEALNTGAIGGAAIDVYEEEPLPVNHPLRSTPKLLLTPHNAFNSFEASRRMSQGCFDPIDALLNKIPPSVICNPQVLTQKNLRASLII
ncbi:MAG: hypothetical protein RL240_3135 [Planctomycetota bacterium]|jgi:phosphoglycerate dehydrogenase-like enzyme